jgi:hypothetical protein
MAVNGHFFKGQFVWGCNGDYNPIWRKSGVILGVDIKNVGWFLVDKRPWMQFKTNGNVWWNLNDYLPKELIKRSIDNAHIPFYMWPKKVSPSHIFKRQTFILDQKLI